jgi:cyclic pyranopterin phosphate synthase
VVPAAEIVDTIATAWPIEPAAPSYRGEVAGRWRYADGGGEFGVISSVTQPFCRDCTRARISAEGKLYTCLFAVDGRDLRAVLRSGATDANLSDVVEATWARRGDRYSELRSAATSTLPKIEMFAMGG